MLSFLTNVSHTRFITTRKEVKRTHDQTRSVIRSRPLLPAPRRNNIGGKKHTDRICPCTDSNGANAVEQSAGGPDQEIQDNGAAVNGTAEDQGQDQNLPSGGHQDQGQVDHQFKGIE
jgi:hypothetical protein